MANERVRILLVEDNPGDIYLFRKAFETAGLNFELTVLRDGGAAIAFVQGEEIEAGSLVPDLIVMDLNLPKHDGAQVLQAIRNNERFARVPVVIASSFPTLNLPEHQKLSVAKYIRKPSDLTEFLNIGAALKQVVFENKRTNAES